MFKDTICVNWLLREHDLFSLSSLCFIILTCVRESRNVTSDNETSSYSPFLSCCLCVIVIVVASLQPMCVWFVEHDICVTAVMTDWTYETKAWAMKHSSLSADTRNNSACSNTAMAYQCQPQCTLLWFSYLMAWLVVTTSTSLLSYPRCVHVRYCHLANTLKLIV